MTRRRAPSSPLSFLSDLFSPSGAVAAVERVAVRGHALTCSCAECRAAADYCAAASELLVGASRANRAPETRREVVEGVVTGEVVDVDVDVNASRGRGGGR